MEVVIIIIIIINYIFIFWTQHETQAEQCRCDNIFLEGILRNTVFIEFIYHCPQVTQVVLLISKAETINNNYNNSWLHFRSSFRSADANSPALLSGTLIPISQRTKN